MLFRSKLISEIFSDTLEIRFACTGEEAMTVSRDFKPDIMLLDIGLRDMNGVEALPNLKVINPDCNIMMMTGSTDSLLINKALTLGACDCIVKPFDIFKMRDKLKKIMLEKSVD